MISPRDGMFGWLWWRIYGWSTVCGCGSKLGSL